MSNVTRLGKFDITGQLGQGSFGIVYRGRDPDLGRDVAIKVCTLDDPELRQRFLREATISGRLDHPNIVTVHAYSGEGGTPYLVQEFLSGVDLREIIKQREPWSVERRLDALIQIAGGLAYAHERGVIHRDIKPANVRVLDDGRVKILDFGIAKLAGDESRLTQKGVTMGTASYLPPEQVRGGEIDTRSDLFSYGVLAYELLTFERPFRGKTISALVYQILYKVPAPLSAVWLDCPPELSEIVGRCLEKEPAQRYADAHRLAADLSAVRDGIRAGRWPALLATTPPRESAVREESSSTASEILSQSLLARTAKEVSSEAPPPVARPVKKRSDNEATQPVPIMGLDPEISGTIPVGTLPVTPTRIGGDEIATVSMELSSLPKPPSLPRGKRAPSSSAAPKPAASTSSSPAVSPAEASPVGSQDELATSGLEIAKLVAQGDLDAALEQLEETIHRQRDATEVTLDAERSTLAMPKAPALPPPLPPLPSSTPGGFEATTGTGEQVLAPPAHVGPKKRPNLPVPLVIGGAAFLLLVAAFLAFFLGREPAPKPAPKTAAIPAPPPSTTPSEQLGSLLVVITPWAEISEITDAAGYVHELPEDPTTPLHLELPEGLYRVTLSVPPLAADQPAEERLCEVRVGVGEVATCAEVVGEPKVTELFKETGWWQ